MASNLYEVLGLDRSASPEDIRKAYRKRALQTHPDRLPQGTTQDEKTRAAEQFRLVNNAYEVLNDPQNRQLYDQHGVWPPPTIPSDPPRHNNDANEQWRPDPFASRFGFGSQRPAFGFASMGGRSRFTFTDPFELFNSLFGDVQAHFDDSPFPSHFPVRSMFDSPFGRSSSFGSPFETIFGGPLFSEPMSQTGPGVRSYSSVTQAAGSNGRWVSESKMTRMVNGRTETIHKRRDAEGNEHITYSSPEGERYTINGVEQPNHTVQSGTAPAAIQNGTGPRHVATAPPRPVYFNTPQAEHVSARSSTTSYAPPPPAAHVPPPLNTPETTYAPPPGPPPQNGAYYNGAPIHDAAYSYRSIPQPPVIPVPRSPQDERSEKRYSHPRNDTHHSSSSSRYREDTRHSHRPDDRRSGHNPREEERRSSHAYHEEDRRSRGPATPVYHTGYEGDNHHEKKRWWRGGW